MNWMLLPLRRYAEISGRARPKEYWFFVLFIILASIVASMIDLALGFGTTTHMTADEPYGFWASWAYSGGGPVLLVFTLAIVIPSLTVGIRRLHDTDRSGWWLLIGLVPLVGTIVLFVFMVMGGTRGPNRFGPDPVDQPLPPA